MKKTIVIAIAAAFAAPAFAGFNLGGTVTPRIGYTTTSGQAEDVASSYNSAAGTYYFNLSGSANAGKGYSGGFSCATVGTTTDGAADAFIDTALPVKHGWDRFYAGNENWSQNATKGGFASYGNVLGDSNGVMCNDEVKGYLTTPYGTVAVGNIINPLRNLWDGTTVDPLYANEYGYYQIADFRANAIRYGHSFGDVSFDVQANISSQPGAAKDSPSGQAVYTAFVNYDINADSSIALGLGFGNGGTNGDKYVSESAGNLKFKQAYGLTAKTALGPVGLAYTFFNGENTGAFEDMRQQNYMENTLKASWSTGAWTLIGIGQFSTQKFFTPHDWGGDYSFKNVAGSYFNNAKIKRQNFDFWAMYSLGGGVKPYARVNYLKKTWDAEDGNVAGQSQSMSATRLEGGFQVAF